MQDSRPRIWHEVPKFADLAELNAWLERRCLAHWHTIRHPEQRERTVAEVWDDEQPHLMQSLPAVLASRARQGVNGKSYTKGEHVRVVMHPIRDGRNAGALCFVIKEDGTFTRPNDGICNSDAMYARWQEKGWLASGKNLDTHPTAD